MRYALRKLIAFVFLGGIFWFVYYDVANIFEPSFQIIIATLVAIFGAFWLIVPWVVIRMRIAKRVKQNQREYEEWKTKIRDKNEELRDADGGGSLGRSNRSKRSRISLEPGELELFHEKGTLYVGKGAGFDEISVACKIGDVAFPSEPRNWRKIQRVHFYLTNRRLIFAGKEIDFKVPLGQVASRRPTPGGVVFEVAGDDGAARTDRTRRMAFTFQNPLIVDDIFGTVSA